MKNYKVKGYITAGGKIFKPGDNINLNEKQAQRLDNLIEAAAVEHEQPKELDYLTVSELKALAKSKGLTGYDKLKKAELIEAINGQGV